MKGFAPLAGVPEERGDVEGGGDGASAARGDKGGTAPPRGDAGPALSALLVAVDSTISFLALASVAAAGDEDAEGAEDGEAVDVAVVVAVVAVVAAAAAEDGDAVPAEEASVRLPLRLLPRDDLDLVAGLSSPAFALFTLAALLRMATTSRFARLPRRAARSRLT